LTQYDVNPTSQGTVMLQSNNPNTKRFLEVAMNDLKQSKIKIKIYKKSIRGIDILDGIDGYFDDDAREIGIYKDHRWLETFVHEYAHFLQWRDGDPTFAAYYKYNYNPLLMIDRWLERKITYDKRVENSFNIIRNNEISCDKMAIKLINKYKLPIQTEKYIKKANFQILFYHCVEKQRTWQVSEIYSNKKLWDCIPKTLRESYVQHVPSKLMRMAIESF
jgi:hypothetical protein